MPLYEYECKCGHRFESIEKVDSDFTTCTKCFFIAQKVFSAEGQSFNLKYSPQKDICDWSGNTTRYYDEYNKMKAEGKNPRIPALDGDG